MWQIIGWIIWGILALLALSFVFSCRVYAQSGKEFQWATGVQTFFFCIIAILFLIFEWNKLHILWITLAAFFIAPLIVLGGTPFLPARVDFPRYIILFLTRMFLNVVLIGIKKPSLE